MAQEVIEAPLPGKILQVNVTVGNTVEEGGVICTIEAMKMENPILSPVKGSVIEVAVSPEQLVKTGEKIAVIEY
ncbi:MAG: biotin/lipoyl-binding protein [Dehalococcoidia bacterium]|nr:biotin/lipoyl-binding protein [Dehalococcoidia bacterium]MQY55863.1 biotin/lipoyl-binding protein [Dehalococcoidia bacterium]